MSKSAWTQRLEALEPNRLTEWLRPHMLRFVAECRREDCIPGEVEVDRWLCTLVTDLQRGSDE